MKSHEIIKKHDGLVLFYPFSGIHFDIMHHLKHSISGLDLKFLFVYCSIGVTKDEYDHWSKNNPLARGHFEDVTFIENKLGLKKIEINSFQKLSDDQFDAEYYTFDTCELIFVKSEVFQYIDYLLKEEVKLPDMNLILSYAQGFDNVLITLIQKFHPIRTEDQKYNHVKIIVVNNHYLEDVCELYAQTNSYQSRIEIEEKVDDRNIQKYSVLFEHQGYYSKANIFGRFF